MQPQMSLANRNSIPSGRRNDSTQLLPAEVVYQHIHHHTDNLILGKVQKAGANFTRISQRQPSQQERFVPKNPPFLSFCTPTTCSL